MASRGIRLVYGGAKTGLMGMVAEGFVRPEHRSGIYFADQPAGLLELLAGFEPARIHKWIDRDLADGTF